jgi:hypothetical protein
MRCGCCPIIVVVGGCRHPVEVNFCVVYFALGFYPTMGSRSSCVGLRKGRNKGNATYNPGCVCLPFLDRECPGMSLDILLDYTPFCGHLVGCGKGTGSTKGYVKNTTPVAIQTLYDHMGVSCLKKCHTIPSPT